MLRKGKLHQSHTLRRIRRDKRNIECSNNEHKRKKDDDNPFKYLELSDVWRREKTTKYNFLLGITIKRENNKRFQEAKRQNTNFEDFAVK